jgi:hypothetical protein
MKETPSEYLKRKGWKQTKTGNPWEWSLPPTPGRFRLGDAVAVQESLDQEKKGNRERVKR